MPRGATLRINLQRVYFRIYIVRKFANGDHNYFGIEPKKTIFHFLQHPINRHVYTVLVFAHGVRPIERVTSPLVK